MRVKNKLAMEIVQLSMIPGWRSIIYTPISFIKYICRFEKKKCYFKFPLNFVIFDNFLNP